MAGAWQAPFLEALRRGGSVSKAAAVAGVTTTGANVARRRCATFAAGWTLAIDGWRGERAAAMMEDALKAPATARWGTDEAGVEARIERVPSSRMSERQEERFLDMLAACANVKRSAAAAGVSAAGCYARRRRCERFAGAWDAALDAGRARVETLLIEAAGRSLDPDTPAGEAERAGLVTMSVEEAMRLLAMARGKPAGRPKSWQVPRPIEEVKASILKRIEAIERHREEDVPAKYRDVADGGEWGG